MIIYAFMDEHSLLEGDEAEGLLSWCWLAVVPACRWWRTHPGSGQSSQAWFPFGWGLAFVDTHSVAHPLGQDDPILQVCLHSLELLHGHHLFLGLPGCFSCISCSQDMSSWGSRSTPWEVNWPKVLFFFWSTSAILSILFFKMLAFLYIKKSIWSYSLFTYF